MADFENRFGIRQIRHILPLMLVTLLPCLSGCFAVRVRHLHWPGVRARTEVPLHHIGAIEFHIVYLNVDSAAPGFSIRMPDGHVLTSDRMTAEALAPHLTQFDHLAREMHPSWSRYAIVEYENGSVRFLFEEDRLSRVALFVRRKWFRRTSVPGLGNATGDKVFPMPVTERELIELFGEPSNAQSYLFNT